MSEYIAKASIEPRDYRVVFLIQKIKVALATFIFFNLRYTHIHRQYNHSHNCHKEHYM